MGSNSCVVPTPADKIPETKPHRIDPPPLSVAAADAEIATSGFVHRAASHGDAQLAEDWREFFAQRKPRDGEGAAKKPAAKPQT
ncbi:hypothetical protein BH09PLA1_BH09PLA1_01020 [soil metagenome]